MKRVAVFAALISLVAVAPSSGAPAQRGVPVFFLQGEQLMRVTRPGSSIADAVRQLMAGPTSREATRQIRTYVPSGTSVRSVAVDGKIVTVDLDSRFLTGHDTPSLLARLAQLVGTATGNDRSLQVQLLVQGKPVSGVFPGVPAETPITLRYLQTPNAPLPPPARERKPPVDPKVRAAQRQLISLGYLPAGSADGRLGPQTEEAILAFQKWERLDRTGVFDAGTGTRLHAASRPTPRIAMTTGKRAEILLDRQVALLIEDNRVVATIAVSTGKPSTPTPAGHYHVYAKIERWWSTPFREWLPWAVPFVGGIAFHQYPIVPAYAASHGCVRQVPAVAQMTYDFADVGMPVDVIARS
jgi:peptidoglycan hydrolase-like protein with peptidoglycan-binding domain